MPSHVTKTAIHWGVGFALAYALQLVFVWAVKDTTIEGALLSATQFPFLFLFCLTVTIYYSAPEKPKQQQVETTVSTAHDTGTANENNSKENTPARPKLHYLTNLKVFLTITVVTHHMAVAFGGIPAAAPLVIGAYFNWWQFAAFMFITLNLSYFMPLFFFISAYFCDSSFNKRGRASFMHVKALRYLLPSMFVVLTLNPYSQMISLAVAGLPIFYYAANTYHVWFLLWLIVFHWFFCTFRQASDKDAKSQHNDTEAEALVSREPALQEQSAAIEEKEVDPQEGIDTGVETPLNQGEVDVEQGSTDGEAEATESNGAEIPKAYWRWLAGGILGVVNAAFTLSMNYYPGFYTIPISFYGTLPSDIFMFCCGIAAARRGWLSALHRNTVLWSYLGMTIVVVVLVTVEYMKAVGRITMSSNGSTFFGGLLGGIFCLDFSVVSLHFFQTFLNKTNRFYKFMGEAAYGVYLIHYILTVVATSVFIKVYNAIYNQEVIFFVESTISWSHLKGPADGAIHLFVGFVVCTIIVQAVVWPVAYGLKQIPGVKQVL